MLRCTAAAAKLAAQAAAPAEPVEGGLKAARWQAARGRHKLEAQVEQVEGGQVKADPSQVVTALDGQQMAQQALLLSCLTPA